MPRRTEKPKNLKNKLVNKQEEVKLAYPDPIDQNKVMMMWSGVIFFSILLVFGWFMSTKNIFQTDESVDSLIASSSDWNQIHLEMERTMEEIKKGVSEIKSTANQASLLSASSTMATSSLELSVEDSVESIQSASSTAGELQNSAIIEPGELENLKIELEKIQTKLK